MADACAPRTREVHMRSAVTRIVLAGALAGGGIVGVQAPARAADCYSINSGSNGALSFCDTTRHRSVVKCRRAANGATYSNTGKWAAVRTFSSRCTAAAATFAGALPREVRLTGNEEGPGLRKSLLRPGPRLLWRGGSTANWRRGQDHDESIRR